jgi:hypothetical protein
LVNGTEVKTVQHVEENVFFGRSVNVEKHFTQKGNDVVDSKLERIANDDAKKKIKSRRLFAIRPQKPRSHSVAETSDHSEDASDNVQDQRIMLAKEARCFL